MANYANYVRFVRGSDLAFAALNQIDKDTLYFITYYERSEENPAVYKLDENNKPIPIKTALYLGDGLVSDSSSNLSDAALSFLNNILPTEDLVDGDLQVWVGEQSETTQDPETGETITTTVPAHWETKSVDDLIPVFQGAVYVENGTNIAGTQGLVPAPGANDYNKFLRGDGTWFDLNADVIQNVITTVIGGGDFDENLDTLLEIATWIQDHPNDASEMNTRIIALEQAIGINQTKIEEVPREDEFGNPVYIQENNDDGEGNQSPLYWTGVTEDNKTTEVTSYPVYTVNTEGEEPQYIWEKTSIDEELVPLYWTGVTDENKTAVESIYPVFSQPIDEEEVPADNDIKILQDTVAEQETNITFLQNTVGDLTSLLEYGNKTGTNGTKTLGTIDKLDSRLTRIEGLLSEENGEITLVVPDVGNLDTLLLRTDPTNEIVNEGDPADIVSAINILDSRTRWQDIN